MLKHVEIGVDLGEYEIKVVKIKQVKDGEVNQLEEFASYPVESELYSDDYFDEVKHAIKSFSKVIKRKRLSLNITLPLNLYSRILSTTVPIVDDKDLDKGIEFEAKQAINDFKDYKLTYSISETYEESNEYKVLVAALSNKMIDKLAKFKTLTVKINKVMLQPNVLERFAKGNDIIIDFGDKDTRVYMYKYGKLSKVEQVNSGGFIIRKAIEDYIDEHSLDESYDELIKEIYVESDLLEEDDGYAKEISSIIKPEITSLLDEVKRVVRSFELQEGINIDDVYYVGGLTELKYLSETLESELDINIKQLNIIAKETDKIKYDLAGMAAIIAKEDSDFNFANEVRMNVDYTSIFIATAAISLSIMLALVLLHGKYDKVLDDQGIVLSEQNQLLSGIQTDIDTVQSTIDESQRFIDTIEMIEKRDIWLSDILYAIPYRTPLNVVISKLDIKDGFAHIEGQSGNYSSIGFFANRLEELGEVEIVSIDDYSEENRYSVITDNPETISNEYVMKRSFVITLKHDNKFHE